MHNCLILGSGRSGTSLTAGLLHRSGYYCGASLVQARDANPGGFYEDHLVNYVNERIMVERVPYHSRAPSWLSRLLGRRTWRDGQLWLAALDEPVAWQPDTAARWIIEDLVAHRPFAYKDPRFSWTLNAWRPFLPECRFVCVFREPGATAASIAKDVRSEPYYDNLRMDAADALALWAAMYRQVLGFHCTDESRWIFVEYDDLVSRRALGPLGRFLGVAIDPGFIDPALNRSAAAAVPVGDAERDLYERLREKARATQAAVAS
jgi:hypothetical protein